MTDLVKEFAEAAYPELFDSVAQDSPREAEYQAYQKAEEGLERFTEYAEIVTLETVAAQLDRYLSEPMSDLRGLISAARKGAKISPEELEDILTLLDRADSGLRYNE